MEVVCAYCGKVMGVKDGNGVSGVSHGICQECFEVAWRKAYDSPGKKDAPPDPGER